MTPFTFYHHHHHDHATVIDLTHRDPVGYAPTYLPIYCLLLAHVNRCILNCSSLSWVEETFVLLAWCTASMMYCETKCSGGSHHRKCIGCRGNEIRLYQHI